ncbi:MAG: ACP S-malonyltransferase, partial [Acidimicrobiia bacterium]
LTLVASRGKHMASAADLEPSGMAALIGADEALARKVVSESEAGGGRLQIANLNAPGQVVVAGSTADLEWLEEHGKDYGVRRVIRLNVAGAFHSSFMSPAADQLAKVMADVSFAVPGFDVFSNVSARPHEPDTIDARLVEQVTSPVRFEESLRNMTASGIGTFVHIGPGDVTAGLAKRTIPDANVFTVASLDDIDSAVESLSTMDH